MRISLLSLVLWTSGLSLAKTQITRRCGAPEPPQALVDAAANDSVADGTPTTETSKTGGHRPIIMIDTYVHVVTTEYSADLYNQSRVQAQIDVMNDRYSPASIGFRLKGTDFTVNQDWATNAVDRTDSEKAMKKALRKGRYGNLNLYFLSNLGGGELLGYCYFPELKVNATTLQQDGCVLLGGTMPGGDVENYNFGVSAVHEIGHWFGLFHVFQGGDCDGPGDYVFDTPAQNTATDGCPKEQDSCPKKPGKDNINNYMDYSYDTCMERFTFGQYLKMHTNYLLYRVGR